MKRPSFKKIINTGVAGVAAAFAAIGNQAAFAAETTKRLNEATETLPAPRTFYQAPPRRPWNVMQNGKVIRHPGVTLQGREPKLISVPVTDAETGEVSTARVQMFSKLNSRNMGRQYPVELKRAVSLAVFNDAKNAARRSAADRFVGTFPTHGKIAVEGIAA